jgi:hypothetical protein
MKIGFGDINVEKGEKIFLNQKLGMSVYIRISG